MKIIRQVWGIGAGLFVSLNLLHATSLRTAVSTDLAVMAAVVEQTTPTPAEEVPPVGVFYSAQNPDNPPYPCNVNALPAWNLGNGMWLLDDLDADLATHAMMSRATSMGVPSPGDIGGSSGGDVTNNYVAYTWDTNQLWLEITNVSNGTTFANLHNATNQVYAIWGASDLATPFADWQVATEMWPVDTNCQLFTVPNYGSPNIFLRAQDWTGVDTDGDGVPDWWIWKYFHTLGLNATNLDSTGRRVLGDDYTNGVDPNVMAFTLSVTNLYVNTTTVPLTINLTAGEPVYYAVLINDTNYADAVWQPYTGTNLVINLDGADGDYDVWVGLKGWPADATATWDTDDINLTLDRVPATVHLTSAVNTTVIKPYLQVQGWADKPLGSLSYDISNACGMVTNQNASVTDVAGYDANLSGYHTNYFQAYDVPLATNDNVITLRVTDRSGNLTATNFTVTLDYATATNPPVVNLIWPQDGMAVSGTNITIRGTMSDETGTLQAQIVDADGNTNTIQGLVERNGMFWIENVPLNTESQITLQATDAAGNVTATNFTVTPSDLIVTIDSTPAGEALYQPSGTVRGTVSDPTATVTVNGMTVTNDFYTDGETWYWTVDDVPIYGMGTATFDVVATTGSGQAAQSRALAQNTSDSGSTANASLAVEMTPAVLISHYNFTETETGNYDDIDDTTVWENVWTRTYDRSLKVGSNGQWQDTYQASDSIYHAYGINIFTNVQSWSSPTVFDPQGFIALDVDEQDAGGASGYNAVNVNVQHNFGKKVHHHWNYSHGYFADITVTADTRWTLFTGGKARVNLQNLFCINAISSSNEGSPGGPIGAELFWSLSQISGVAATAIEVLGQALDQEGNGWTIQPNNTAVDLNLQIPSKNHTSAGASQSKYIPTVTANGVPLEPDNVVSGADFCVGQYIQFDISGLPSSVNNLTAVWTLPGTFVNTNSDPNCDLFYEKIAAFLKPPRGTSATHCWYVKDGQSVTASVRARYTLGTNPHLWDFTYTGQFNVHRPTTATASPYQPDGTPTVRILYGSTLSLGISGVTNDMSFQHTITTDGFCGGQAGYVQLITSGDYTSSGTGLAFPAIPNTELDGKYGEFPADRQTTVPANTTTTINKFYDAPSDGLHQGNAKEELEFSTYLMFKPNGGIWVPLRLIQWGLQDEAANYSLVNGAQHVTGPSDTESIAFPDWQGKWTLP
jgi:hypothetical protein